MIKSFWSWMFSFRGEKRGLRLLVSWWILIDCLTAGILTFGLNVDGFHFAQIALFPAASILMGMAVAWTAQATVIVSSKDFQDKIITDERPLEDYIYGYQLSILILFITIGFMAIMSAGGFNFYVYDQNFSQITSSFSLFFLVCMSTRECWSIVNFTSLVALLDSRLKRGKQ